MSNIENPASTKLLKYHWRNIAIKNGIKTSTFYERVNNLKWPFEKAATKKVVNNPEYAVYKGEELVVMGTLKECAEHLDVTEGYIYWLTMPSGKKIRSTKVVKLEDEE